MERLWIGAVLLPLALLAAGCGDSESSLDALGAAEGLYDGVKAANGMYDVAGNRALERDEAPVVTRAHLDRIRMGMTEQEVEAIIDAPPTARTETMNGATGLSIVNTQWVNGDLSEASFRFGDGKLGHMSQTGIR